MKFYELDLPPQYVELAHVRFDDVKTGFLYDLKAVLPGILLTIIGWIIVRSTIAQVLISLVIFAVSIYPYFSLHEIVHGVVIKVMTGQRVEIGFNKSGAYCGMPELYIQACCDLLYRSSSLCVFCSVGNWNRNIDCRKPLDVPPSRSYAYSASSWLPVRC